MRSIFGAVSIAFLLVACGLDDTVADFADDGSMAVHPGSDASFDATSASDATSPPTDSAVPPDVDASSPVTGYQKPLTIQSSKVGATLTDFPVWISLADADLAAHAAANGKDIFFTGADGSALAYEIQSWNPSGGHLAAWVKIPSLSSAANTVIDVRYGNAAGVPAPSSAAVFSAGFVAVWHLESPAGTSFGDALGTHAGTAVGLAADPTVAAQLGRGAAFDGGAGDITFTNTLTGGGAHTFSIWVLQSATTDNDALIVIGNNAQDQSRWLHSVFSANAVSPTKVAIGFYGDDWVNPNIDVIGAGWTLLDWVYDGAGNSTMYVNGAFAAGPNAVTGTVNTQGAGGHIGNAPAGWGQNMGVHATLDEARIANVARTPQWIATEFANQNNAPTFYSVSAEQTLH